VWSRGMLLLILYFVKLIYYSRLPVVLNTIILGFPGVDYRKLLRRVTLPTSKRHEGISITEDYKKK